MSREHPSLKQSVKRRIRSDLKNNNKRILVSTFETATLQYNLIRENFYSDKHCVLQEMSFEEDRIQ